MDAHDGGEIEFSAAYALGAEKRSGVWEEQVGAPRVGPLSLRGPGWCPVREAHHEVGDGCTAVSAVALPLIRWMRSGDGPGPAPKPASSRVLAGLVTHQLVTPVLVVGDLRL